MDIFRKRTNGMALIIALIAIMVILASLSLVIGRVISSKKSTDEVVGNGILDEACKAGIEIGMEKVWNQYLAARSNVAGNLASYRTFETDVLNLRNNEDINGNGTKDGTEKDTNGSGTFDINPPLTIVTKASPGTWIKLGEKDATITSLTVSRTDDPTGSTLTFSATASYQGQSQSAIQTARVSGPPFRGYEYAVLANNINCTLCHAGITAYDIASNTDTTKYNTFDRIKVATLESLLFRSTSADSNVAGTVYTRGGVYDTDGSAMSAAKLSTSDFTGFSFSNTTEKITQDPTGKMSSSPLVNTGKGADGKLLTGGNLYTNYPTASEQMTDGDLPSSFPAPFPDIDEDRVVDDNEFTQVAQSQIGSISGGIVYGVASGSTYSGTALPAASNAALASMSSGGTYNGNVILVGTAANPINISGGITVNGDLVIKGKVKGRGQIFVRNNVYVAGDVTYADAAGKFGVASDGTENALALTAGGSILIGDYLTVRGANHSKETSDKYPDVTTSIDVRQRNVSKSETISKVTETIKYGYFDPSSVDAGQISANTINPVTGATEKRNGNQFSFTTAELMLFNDMELEKALADATYKPRFYGLRETQPNNIYTYYNGTDEHAVHYDESSGGVKLISAYLTSKGYPLSILSRATYQYMNPKGNWISETSLREIWYADEMARANGDKFKFDGLLYSNNAIFAITRSAARHKSYTQGKMLIRGGIVCPDLGVLVAGPDTAGTESMTVLYDRRVKGFWTPADTTKVFLQRLVFKPVKS